MMSKDQKQNLTKVTTGALVLLLSGAFIPYESTMAQTGRANQLSVIEHINKGTYYCRRRQFQEAINEYEQALNIDSTSQAAKDGIALTHLNWGALYVNQNRFDEAIAEFELVLKFDPYNRMAKHNIAFVRQQQARLGTKSADKTNSGLDKEGKKAGKPPEPPPSAILLLSPGLKQSSSAKTQEQGNSEDEAATETEGSSAQAAAETDSASTDASSTNANQATTSWAQGSLEDQLTAIENKIYGQKQANLTVLKRLEKMEVDTTGQVRTGSIKERIEYLKQSYGL